MKIPTIKGVVDIIDRVLVPYMEMHIKNAEDENNEMEKLPFDGSDYMYNRGQIDATSNDMEVLKNISSLLKEKENDLGQTRRVHRAQNEGHRAEVGSQGPRQVALGLL